MAASLTGVMRDTRLKAANNSDRRMLQGSIRLLAFTGVSAGIAKLALAEQSHAADRDHTAPLTVPGAVHLDFRNRCTLAALETVADSNTRS